MAQEHPEGGETRSQSGRPLRERADEGADQIGQDRAGHGESRYVEDPDQLVRLDHSQPLESPPQQASAAAQAAEARGEPPGPKGGPGAPTLLPAGPAVWEAREPGQGD